VRRAEEVFVVSPVPEYEGPGGIRSSWSA